MASNFRARKLLATLTYVIVVCTGSAPAQAITLEEAVRAAVTTNPTARAAEAGVQASAMELLQLEREYLLSLKLYGELGTTWFDDPDRLNIIDQKDTKIYRDVGIVGEFTIFDGYRRSNLVYQNAAALDGSIFRLFDASETMALNAVEAYVDVLRHRSLLQVTIDNIARHREIIEQVDELVEAGRLPASTGFEAAERLSARESTRQTSCRKSGYRQGRAMARMLAALLVVNQMSSLASGWIGNSTPGAAMPAAGLCNTAPAKQGPNATLCAARCLSWPNRHGMPTIPTLNAPFSSVVACLQRAKPRNNTKNSSKPDRAAFWTCWMRKGRSSTSVLNRSARSRAMYSASTAFWPPKASWPSISRSPVPMLPLTRTL